MAFLDKEWAHLVTVGAVGVGAIASYGPVNQAVAQAIGKPASDPLTMVLGGLATAGVAAVVGFVAHEGLKAVKAVPAGKAA